MTSPYLGVVAEVYPTPTLSDGQPQTWGPSSQYRVEDWGRYRIVVGSPGVDLTYYRNTPTVIESWTTTDPFGDATATIVFPQITPFEDVETLFPPMTPIEIRKVNGAEADEGARWSGVVVAYVDRSEGVGLECVGSLFDLDRFRKWPDFDDTEDWLGTRDTGEHIWRAIESHRIFYGTNTLPMTEVTTGIDQRAPGSFDPVCTHFMAEVLARAQAITGYNNSTGQFTEEQWTVDCQGRQPVMALRDRTTVHWTVHAGARGVNVELRRDYLATPNVMWGEGVDEDNCRWRNTKYPHQRTDTGPPWPAGYLPFTVLTGPGGGHQEAADQIKDELRATGFNMGLSPNGTMFVQSDFSGPIRAFKWARGLYFGAANDWNVFGQADWNALFQNEAGEIGAPFFEPVWSDPRVRLFDKDSRGVTIGANPDYDPTVPRIESYTNYGKSNKFAALLQAYREVAHYGDEDFDGRIVLEADPLVGATASGDSRFEIRAGENIQVKGYRGGDVLLHIVRCTHEQGSSTLVVDSAARDYMTIHAMHERDQLARDDPAARIRQRISKSKIVEDESPLWDCEGGAGYLTRAAVQFGQWTIYPVPAARFGTITEVRLRMEEIELTGQIPTFVVSIWGQPVTSAQVMWAATQGPGTLNTDLGTESGGDLFDDLPENWPGGSLGTGRIDLVYAAGRGGATGSLGWWPHPQGDHNDVADQANITGEFRDSGDWAFVSSKPPWLWVAVLSTGSSFLSGRLHLVDTYPDPVT